MKKLITIITIIIALASCATIDNYEFGDITRKLIEKKKEYCQATNRIEREAILTLIRTVEPTWVPVCTYPFGLLLDE